MTKLEAYLATIKSPMHAAKARAALETQVRYNGKEFLTRHSLIERKIADGSTVILNKHFGPVLMHPDGCFLDKANITLQGLKYATWLNSNQSQTSPPTF